ncbi:hypothetical protein BKE30_14625 [Alkanindiges hydrocarboniclasticus]|uniref:Bacterial type II secretion system protein E domain-containing protein n=1 Tax=Alkanindiges hydrocarboniclasticus TaxID=1907941 RepID=A0A1S8CQX2_9GAMM|nr:GspE/PulE family protein [Alkanindiges hydrocarboniclasticus]ONG37363.1 hypothetical protein BKE30_14625 [Alkanindiges hydrocarboniclasticus]
MTSMQSPANAVAMEEHKQFISSNPNDPLDQKAVEILNDVFAYALFNKASDVHFETAYDEGLVRVRQDGELRIIHNLPKNLIVRISEKIMSRADIAASTTKTPQDGRTYLFFPKPDNSNEEVRVDLRINILPSMKGRSIVCRLLDQSNAGKSLNEIHMTKSVREAIGSLITSPTGLFYVVGETGSGKTTTLYAILNELNDSARKIITIEDPVEYQLPFLQQVNVDKSNSFETALRACMRQDPDVILVGEIRDKVTAQIAVQAAQTGHLVLSTLHANDSVAAITRLIDLGVDRYSLGEVLRGILAQRLVRQLKNSKMIDEANEEQKSWLMKNGFGQYANQSFGKSGIDAYSGRLPVMEMLLMSNDIKELVFSGNTQKIYEVAKNQPQYETLANAAIRLSMEGKTSLNQARLIAGSKVSSGMQGLKIGERLINLGYLSNYQLEQALEIQRFQRSEHRQRLGDILIDMKFCNEDQINESLRAI